MGKINPRESEGVNTIGAITRRDFLAWVLFGGAAILAGSTLSAVAAEWDSFNTPTCNSTLIAITRTPSKLSKQGIVNDASGLNPTKMARIVQPTSEEEVREALAYAQKNGLTISISGSRHSMGGQALYPNALLLDMTRFRGATYNPEKQTVKVRTGSTWADLQFYLDPKGRSVNVMQASNIFTVGGSISVNCHGLDRRFATLGSTVNSLRIMLADGSVVTASRNENADLFAHAIGGYGLYGVVLEAELTTSPNLMYRHEIHVIPMSKFFEFYENAIASNSAVHLLQGRVSVSPASFMNELIMHTWKEDSGYHEKIPALEPIDCSHLEVLGAKLPFNVSMHSSLGKRLMWEMEKHVEPGIEKKILSRNQAMSPPFEFLRGNSTTHTQILHEYFFPKEKLVVFASRFREACLKNQPNLLYISLREVRKDTTSALPYAKQESFSMVLYLDQKATRAGQIQMNQFTIDAADAVLAVGGTFYLPYQLVFTKEQIKKAYPEIGQFFARKKYYDPGELFRNTLYEKYT